MNIPKNNSTRQIRMRDDYVNLFKKMHVDFCVKWTDHGVDAYVTRLQKIDIKILEKIIDNFFWDENKRTMPNPRDIMLKTNKFNGKTQPCGHENCMNGWSIKINNEFRCPNHRLDLF